MTRYYTQLGVNPNATLEEIKAAYRERALATHPDKVPGKEAEFNRIQKTYEVLSDPEKRQAYDARSSSLLNSASHLERMARQGLRFFLVQQPEDYDLYTYFNLLFNCMGNKL